MKERFNRKPEDISAGIEQLIDIVNSVEYDQAGKPPSILLVCPTIVDESVEGVKEKYRGAEEKSRKLGQLYKEVADKHSLPFIDLSKHVLSSKKDGYHFDKDTHKKVAEILFGVIRDIYFK